MTASDTVSFDYAGWREAMRRYAARLTDEFETRFGYPPGEQVVGDPTDVAIMDNTFPSHPAPVPETLLDFYREVSRVSLPDVWVGYFIAPLERVLDGLDGGDPVHMGGRWNTPIITFGSDGGGTMFALGMPQGTPVYVLPEGAVHDQVYEDSALPRIVAEDLPAFLGKLRDTMVAFLEDAPHEAGRYLTCRGGMACGY